MKKGHTKMMAPEKNIKKWHQKYKKRWHQEKKEKHGIRKNKWL